MDVHDLNIEDMERAGREMGLSEEIIQKARETLTKQQEMANDNKESK